MGEFARSDSILFNTLVNGYIRQGLDLFQGGQTGERVVDLFEINGAAFHWEFVSEGAMNLLVIVDNHRRSSDISKILLHIETAMLVGN